MTEDRREQDGQVDSDARWEVRDLRAYREMTNQDIWSVVKRYFGENERPVE